jgi:RNA polymerase sigma-70 factor (ECF subfamily)
MDDPDVETMLRVKEGDESAFRALFRKHSPRVLQFMRRYVGDDAVADELTQDVFVQIFKARGRYQPDARFSTWLYAIATNLCRNELRRSEHQLRVRPQKVEHEEDAPEFDPVDAGSASVEDEVAGRELEIRLRAALARLPGKQRAALLLSRVDGLAYRDVGTVLRCSEGAVKALLFRATHSLKRDLHDVLDPERQRQREYRQEQEKGKDNVVPKSPEAARPVS